MPKLTVILTTYNGEQYLSETIKSIITQSFIDFELLIIDDGSSYKTAQIVKSFHDRRIIYCCKNHEGHVEALNYGIKLSNSKIICNVDHDDILLPGKLELQYNLLQKNENLGVVSSSCFIIDDKSKIKYKIMQPPGNSLIKKYLLYKNVLLHSGVMYRKVLLEVYGHYRTEFSTAADYDLWLRLRNVTNFYNIPEPLVLIRKHEIAQTYYFNNVDIFKVLNANKYLLTEKEQEIFPHIWKVKYNSSLKGRVGFLCNFFNYDLEAFERIKILVLSLLNRRIINFYYSFHPFHRIAYSLYYLKELTR